MEAGVLDVVERCSDLHLRVPLGEVVDDRRDAALVGDILEVRVVGRKRLVEERATEGGLDEPSQRLAVDSSKPSGCVPSAKCMVGETDAHLGVEVERVLVEGEDRLGDRGERTAFAGDTLLERWSGGADR